MAVAVIVMFVTLVFVLTLRHVPGEPVLYIPDATRLILGGCDCPCCAGAEYGEYAFGQAALFYCTAHLLRDVHHIAVALR